MTKRNVLLIAVLAFLWGCGADNPLQRGEASIALGDDTANPSTGNSPCAQALLLAKSSRFAAVTQQSDCPSFSADVFPVLQSCSGCHAGGAGGWTYNGGPQAYAQVLSAVDVDAADQSILLLKATNQNSHGGGALFAPDSAEFNSILTWIALGTPDD